MLIETYDLTKIYSGGENEVRALDGVSLDVDRGEFVAVVGSSGSENPRCYIFSADLTIM